MITHGYHVVSPVATVTSHSGSCGKSHVAWGHAGVAMAPSRCIAPALMRYAPPPALAGRRLASHGGREYHSRLFLLWLRSAPGPPPAREARLGSPPGGSSASSSRAPLHRDSAVRRGGPLHREVALRQLRPRRLHWPFFGQTFLDKLAGWLLRPVLAVQPVDVRARAV